MLPSNRYHGRQAAQAEMDAPLVLKAETGKRLDHFLQEKLPQFSRSRLQSWIKEARVLVNQASAKPSLLLRGGELVEIRPAGLPPLKAVPEDLPVEILYEDAALLAINKPSGLVVHAGAGAHAGTLVNRLVHHFGTLSSVGGDLRPGIVHRLDKETSGVLLVARTDPAHRALAEQFSSRTVEKTYLALVQGLVKEDTGRITKPIARDPGRRIRMTTKIEHGRAALTTYKVLERFPQFTYLEVRIGTGRTHQIRVHLASLGHPVAGDRLYGAAPAERMFLHAHRIVFRSPATQAQVSVEVPLPFELKDWLDRLREGAYNLK
jgi:23S rRNA pseudouridine1911/1915/1917 synthase